MSGHSVVLAKWRSLQAMLNCKDCEFYHQHADGSPNLQCDPFSTIKEPECLLKLQLMQLMSLTRSNEATQAMHRRFAPLQEKMFKHMEREIDEANEADQWKAHDDMDDEDQDPFQL